MGYTVVLRDWQNEVVTKRHFVTLEIAELVAANWEQSAYDKYDVQVMYEPDDADILTR